MMQSLYHWAMGGPVGTFRTQDLLIRYTRNGFSVRYRSPLWCRLPALTVTGVFDVGALLGLHPRAILGTEKR